MKIFTLQEIKALNYTGVGAERGTKEKGRQRKQAASTVLTYQRNVLKKEK